jgi:acetyltransferase-like isoleucine patch superfamily enzyme
MVRILIAFASLFLPGPLKRLFLTHTLGYRIDTTARIGFSIIICREAVVERNATIGHFTLIRNLDRLHMRHDSIIGNLNAVVGIRADTPFFRHQNGRTAELILGQHSAITSRHLLDCSNSIRVGAFTTIAGFGSQFLTHSVNLQLNRQESAPITVGDYCFIGTQCTVLPGSVLPSCSVLGAKALLRTPFTEPWTMYAGVPAVKLKALPKDWAYFARTKGAVQ